MLDANELRLRLIEAMDKAEPRVTSARLAAVCKVTAQAVNGWRKTGRIAKRHLKPIADETKKPLEYFLEEKPGALRVNDSLTLNLEEQQAMKQLQASLPEWRRYVLSLAMLNRESQQLFLTTMGATVPDSVVRAAYGDVPTKGK